jgi:hypothetical protein
MKKEGESAAGQRIRTEEEDARSSKGYLRENSI